MDTNSKLLNYLSAFITEERLNQLERVLDQRTKHFTVALENIYQPHNSNAVIRSCDCFGIQDCHVIESFNEFKTSKQVSKGAIKWVDVYKYNHTTQAIDSLKSKGYQIVATTPHTSGFDLQDFDISKPSALFFGAEKKGLSEDVLQKADSYIKIPMVGHTESLNISVSAAIVLQHLSQELRKSTIDWRLSDKQFEQIRLEWVKKSVARVETHLRQFEHLHS